VEGEGRERNTPKSPGLRDVRNKRERTLIAIHSDLIGKRCLSTVRKSCKPGLPKKNNGTRRTGQQSGRGRKKGLAKMTGGRVRS